MEDFKLSIDFNFEGDDLEMTVNDHGLKQKVEDSDDTEFVKAATYALYLVSQANKGAAEALQAAHEAGAEGFVAKMKSILEEIEEA